MRNSAISSSAASVAPELECRVAALEQWAASSYRVSTKLLQTLNGLQRTFGKH